ncbi:MAG: thiamine phosphate synthase [Spirochaetes bacterium]|nr:thiamine phosphate synthase [Spirochaetota bacterium]
MKFAFPSPLYCITDESLSRGRDNISVIRMMLSAGVKIIQYREKNKSMRDKYTECVLIRRLTADAKALFIVNDDIHLALAVHADGVHIGQHDMPCDVVRGLVTDMILGLSIETAAQLNDPAASSADYFGVGPVFSTATKPDAAAPLGLEGLTGIVRMTDKPVVAIGGIKESNMTDILKTGAHCAAVISDIVGADDIPAKIKRLLTR